jgi:hypothetical protein
MKKCELKEIGAEGYEKGVVEFKSTEEWMKITSLFLLQILMWIIL